MSRQSPSRSATALRPATDVYQTVTDQIIAAIEDKRAVFTAAAKAAQAADFIKGFSGSPANERE